MMRSKRGDAEDIAKLGRVQILSEAPCVFRQETADSVESVKKAAHTALVDATKSD